MGRLGLGLEPHIVGRLGSRVSVGASFQIFALAAGGCSRWGRKCPGEICLAGEVSYTRTTAVHYTAQNSSENIPSYPPNVYWRQGCDTPRDSYVVHGGGLAVTNNAPPSMSKEN